MPYSGFTSGTTAATPPVPTAPTGNRFGHYGFHLLPDGPQSSAEQASDVEWKYISVRRYA
jgi:hypothetical protein